MKKFRVVAAVVCIIFLFSLVYLGSEGGGYASGTSSALTVSISPASAALNLGQSQMFTAIPSGGSGSYTSYQWYVGGTSQSGQTTSTFNYTPTSEDLYSITVTVTDSTGATSAQSTAAMVIVVGSATTVSVSPESATVSVGQSQLFTAIPSGSVSYMGYQWYVDGSEQSGQTTSTFNYSPASAGTYSITVWLTNSTGFPFSQSPPATLTVSVTATPTPTPTQMSTPASSSSTVPATTDNNSTVDLAVSGNITCAQMSDVTITINQSASKTEVSFTVTGESGTIGFGNITIPKSAVPDGTTPTIYIDSQPAQNQGYTQDTNNYNVWYTTHFSTHQISIVFTTTASSPAPTSSSQTSAQSSLLQVIYGILAAIAIVAVVIVALKLIIKDKSDKAN